MQEKGVSQFSGSTLSTLIVDGSLYQLQSQCMSVLIAATVSGQDFDGNVGFWVFSTSVMGNKSLGAAGMQTMFTLSMPRIQSNCPSLRPLT